MDTSANMTNRSQSTRRKRADDDEPAVAATATATAAFPPWVMFEKSSHTRDDIGGGCSSSSIADTKTLASCLTTGGLRIDASLCLAAPPEASRVRVQFPAAAVEPSLTLVLAAHRDSLVVQVVGCKKESVECVDYFVYNAGDAAAAATPRRLPSLLLLPAYYTTDGKGRLVRHYLLDSDGTGLLRRGEGELVVAGLRMGYKERTTRKAAELHLFRSGEWCVKRPLISHHDGGGGGDLPSWWRSTVVVPAGDDMLCWVDLSRGLLFSRVFDESPGLLYVPLPEDSKFLRPSYRNVCVTASAAGGGAIKFVDISPRCCCGAAATYCRHSRHAYTVRTWTLRMEDMEWVIDGVLDAAQLWALDAYNGLPRVELDYPMVSMDDPHCICFVVCEWMHEKDGDRTQWRIMVDMRSKTIQSVFCCPKGYSNCRHIIPSTVCNYVNNSEPSSSNLNDDPDTVQAESALRLMSKKIKLQTNSNTIGSVQPPSCGPSSTEAMILAALEEIPGLDRDDKLKAYRILSHDDSGRRFRSLIELPMDLRKDCVLMDIKASEACVVCSACSAELQL